MPQLKEHLRGLVEEAIPKSDVAVVNFQALRDLLAASIGHHTDGGVKPGDSSKMPQNYGSDTKSNGQKSSERKSLHNSSPQTSAYVRKSIIKSSNMRNLTDKFDSILNRFETFSTDLSHQMEKLNNRVKNLENICLVKK